MKLTWPCVLCYRSSCWSSVSRPDEQCSYISACKPLVSATLPVTCSVRACARRHATTLCWRWLWSDKLYWLHAAC